MNQQLNRCRINPERDRATRISELQLLLDFPSAFQPRIRLQMVLHVPTWFVRHPRSGSSCTFSLRCPFLAGLQHSQERCSLGPDASQARSYGSSRCHFPRGELQQFIIATAAAPGGRVCKQTSIRAAAHGCTSPSSRLLSLRDL